MDSEPLKLVPISDPVAVAAPRISASRGWVAASRWGLGMFLKAPSA